MVGLPPLLRYVRQDMSVSVGRMPDDLLGNDPVVDDAVSAQRLAGRVAAADETLQAGPTTSGWPGRYAQRVMWTDVAVIAGAVLLGQFVRFGADPLRPVGKVEVPALVVSLALIAAWHIALRLTQASDPRILGSGAVEYNRVLRACFGLFGAWAMVDLAANLSIARGFIAIVLPAGTVMLVVSRWGWRRWVARGRTHGRYLRSVLVVGSLSSATALIARLTKTPALGYRVVGVCIDGRDTDEHTPTPTTLTYRTAGGDDTEVLLFVGIDRTPDLVRTCGANTVAVTSVDSVGHDAMRELSWDLEGIDVEMLVAPGLLDVAGPRITMRPEAGLPLLHIDKPKYQGATKLFKLTFDKVFTAVGLLLLSPLMVLCAIAIKIDSRGPVFYKAERMGTGNSSFSMWKFRSMVVEADTLRAGLRGSDQGNGVLFKLRDDPRVTRVGRLLRRYSLDELPQLFNVLAGTMSLVGPRPPLREEVQTYDHVVLRRMLVRPGMTGLWQVSGRSDLSWDESVQLDLSYVENWSLTNDLIILWRTARAVLTSRGAY